MLVSVSRWKCSGTAIDNIGLLEKNGFGLTRRMEKNMEINGKWIDSLIYEKMNDNNGREQKQSR